MTKFLFLFLIFLFAFVPVFSIGWLRSRRNPRPWRLFLGSAVISAGLTALVVGGIMALFFYATRDREDAHYAKPLTVEEARREGCPIPLPDSARNVKFETISGGIISFEMLIRFEASPEVCRAEVQTVLSAKTPPRRGPAPGLEVLRFRAMPEDNDMAGRAAWFDVERINHGLTADDSPASNYRFWIDEDRGVFYCKLTD